MDEHESLQATATLQKAADLYLRRDMTPDLKEAVNQFKQILKNASNAMGDLCERMELEGIFILDGKDFGSAGLARLLHNHRITWNTACDIYSIKINSQRHRQQIHKFLSYVLNKILLVNAWYRVKSAVTPQPFFQVQTDEGPIEWRRLFGHRSQFYAEETLWLRASAWHCVPLSIDSDSTDIHETAKQVSHRIISNLQHWGYVRPNHIIDSGPIGLGDNTITTTGLRCVKSAIDFHLEYHLIDNGIEMPIQAGKKLYAYLEREKPSGAAVAHFILERTGMTVSPRVIRQGMADERARQARKQRETLARSSPSKVEDKAEVPHAETKVRGRRSQRRA